MDMQCGWRTAVHSETETDLFKFIIASLYGLEWDISWPTSSSIIYNRTAVISSEGGPMSNLGNALQQLREERKQVQQQMQKLDAAISAIETVAGNGISARNGSNQPVRLISAASRRRMAQAQKARRARERQGTRSSATAKDTAPPRKRTMSEAARKRIAAYQRARWAKFRAEQKKAA